MANLETRSKRASSIQALMPFMIAPPLPDGTISQGDRQHIAWMYSGILATEFLATFLTYILTRTRSLIGVNVGINEEIMTVRSGVNSNHLTASTGVNVVYH